jgi:ketol-acid reductoisomerase
MIAPGSPFGASLMPLTVITDPDLAPLDPLRGKTIAVIGFGGQGSAHALNLRDSDLDIIVGARPDSPGARRAIEAGFTPIAAHEAAGQADLIIMAVPDEAHGDVWDDVIAPHARPGVTIGFMHGFSIRYQTVQPDDRFGIVMVAPKAPGPTLRARFEDGQGIPCLFAVHQDSPAGDAEALGLAWAAGVGCARAAIVRTTFGDEAETDLFGEQAVLCGGLKSLVSAAFQTLVDAGYPPELAYMECCHEVKQVADLLYQHGMAGMMDAISNTAEFGAYRAEAILGDDAIRQRMSNMLSAIRDGTFARVLADDYEDGFTWFNAQRTRADDDPLEDAGRAVRAWMPWLEHEQP